MKYNLLKKPKLGKKIEFKNDKISVPDNPIIPFIEGDGIGPDIWSATKNVIDAAVKKAYDGKKEIAWYKIYAATSGDINDSFTAATDKANDVFAVKIKEKADIVVSVAKYPMDIDLYQSQKAIDNAKLALKKDGILILVSKCRCGIGHDTFVNLMGSCDSPKEVFEKIEKEYVVGYHKAAKMAEIGRWAQIWGITDLPHDVLQKVFIRPFDSLQLAIDSALKLKGENAKILFMMDGSITVPMLSD